MYGRSQKTGGHPFDNRQNENVPTKQGSPPCGIDRPSTKFSTQGNMKRHGSILVTLLWWLSSTLPFAAIGSEGVVLNERVNIRTRPSIASEVIQQLNTGTSVTILDRINLNDPQPGEPRDWFRIAIPESTELWISSQYIDTASNAVSASRLNVRAGPGQNFSVVGRIERGTIVEPLRVSAGWTAIKPLEATVAYVAQEYIRESSTANANDIIEPVPVVVPAISTTDSIPEVIIDEENELASTTNKTAEAIQRPAYSETPQTTFVPPPAPTSTAQETSLFDSIGRADSTASVSRNNSPPGTVFMPIEASEPITATPTFPTTPTLETTNTIPEPIAAELKRVITRDGIVKRARNIQAPTYHRLDDPRTGTTINYLYTGKLQVSLGTGPKALRPYEGRKIRVVGAEAVDARWPSIPVIEVEQLRILE